MYVAFAIFLALHGIAHLVGFLVPWKILTSDEMPYSTTLLAGRLDVGDLGIRIVGLLWLVLAAAFLWSAWSVWTQQAAALRPVVLPVALASLTFCLLGWPEARIGAFVNAGILIVVLWAAA